MVFWNTLKEVSIHFLVVFLSKSNQCYYICLYQGMKNKIIRIVPRLIYNII